MNKSNLLFHFLWFVPFLLLGMPHLSAQQLSQIRGTVLDHAGAPLPGVSIVATALGESKAATSSNARGEFVLTGLKADKSYGIHFTLIGYQAYEEKNFLVKAGDTNSILVRLHMTSSDLDEVVVIGYGNQKRGNLTTAISSLANVQKQTERPTTNIGEMLQGNIAGVTVMSTGGDPSANPTVLIRGMGTLSDESPLYVVDGVPYYGGPLNPNDIESIDIMKDAASAAIYGAQAASGVIAITTKSGKVGAPRFNIDMYKGWHNATSLPSALNAQEYARVYREAAAAAGTTPAAGHDPAKNPWGQETRTVWMDEIFQTGQITNLSAQVSGGSERSKYSTSFGYHDKEGLLKNTNYRRFTYRLKSEYDLSKRVQVGQNFFVNHSTSRGTNTSSSYSGSIINAIYMNPAAPVYDANGLFHGTVPFDLSGFSSAYGDTYNPVALLLRPTVSNPNLNLNGNAFIKVDILDGLTFKSNFAVDLTRYSYKRFDPKIPEIGRSNSMNYLEHNERNTNRWIWDQQLNYRRSFGKHTFDALGVYSVQKTRIDDYTVRAQDFAREDDWYQYIGNAGRILDLPTSIVTEDALISAIGRIMYEYDDRYFLSGSFRQDRTSRLATAHQVGSYPSISGAWKISSESFFNVPFIDNLKLKAAWGQIGNIRSVSAYAFDVPLSTGTTTPMGKNGVLLRHFAVSQKSNPDLVWEGTETFDVGLDLSMFRQFTLNVEYYQKKTKGLLYENSVDPHSGYVQGPISNIGDVMNQGMEFSAGYNNQFGDWKLNLNANLAFNKNELLNLDGYNNRFIQHPDNVRSVLLPYRSEAGQSLYSYYLVQHAGIFNSKEEIDAYTHEGKLIQPNARPGDLKFIDQDGDGNIDDDDRVYMGSAIPKFNYGFSANTSYKNFDLSILTYGVYGTKIFNGYKYTAYNAGMQGYNLDSRVLNAWTPSNTDTDIPVLSTRDPNSNFGTASDWYLESGDYFRVKNITLGYTLPTSALQKLSDQLKARIYFSAENPFTFTSYSGIDPEVGRVGLDVANYPLPRTFTAGININF